MEKRVSVKSWKSYTHKIMCVYLYMGIADFLEILENGRKGVTFQEEFKEWGHWKRLDFGG